MKLEEGMEVGISVKALYELERNLLFGRIVTDFATKENDCDYYDLYNEDGELACLDGETVKVDQVGVAIVTFRNDNGDGTIYFALTHDECDAAVFQ